MKECLEDKGRPESLHGLIGMFVTGFATEDMKSHFDDIAAEYYRGETFWQVPENRKYIQELTSMDGLELGIGDLFIYTTLEIMLAGAFNGSEYSRDFLIILYKNYYKDDYNILKRSSRLLDVDTNSLTELETRRYLSSCHDYKKDVSKLEPEELDNIYYHRDSRLIIMGMLMNMEIESIWNIHMHRMNEVFERDYMGKRRLILEKRWERTHDPIYDNIMDTIEWICNKYPELKRKYVGTELNKCEPEYLLSLAEYVIRQSVAERAGNPNIIFNNYHFNLATSMTEMVMSLRTQDEKEATKETNIMLLSVIYHLAGIIALQERNCKDVMRNIMGIDFKAAVPDDEDNEEREDVNGNL